MYTVSPLLALAVMSWYFVRLRNWGSRELLGWDVAEPVVRKSPEAQSFLAFGCPSGVGKYAPSVVFCRLLAS